jgi:hypothetical protein
MRGLITFGTDIALEQLLGLSQHSRCSKGISCPKVAGLPIITVDLLTSPTVEATISQGSGPK